MRLMLSHFDRSFQQWRVLSHRPNVLRLDAELQCGRVDV